MRNDTQTIHNLSLDGKMVANEQRTGAGSWALNWNIKTLIINFGIVMETFKGFFNNFPYQSIATKYFLCYTITEYTPIKNKHIET